MKFFIILFTIVFTSSVFANSNKWIKDDLVGYLSNCDKEFLRDLLISSEVSVSDSESAGYELDYCVNISFKINSQRSINQGYFVRYCGETDKIELKSLVLYKGSWYGEEVFRMTNGQCY